jgi:hypothetical protein
MISDIPAIEPGMIVPHLSLDPVDNRSGGQITAPGLVVLMLYAGMS